MFISILGILLFLASTAISSPNTQAFRFSRPLKLAGLALFIVGILLASIVQIDAGKIGVKSLFGQIDATPLESGLHLVNPLAKVQQLEGRTQNYTMSAVHDEGDVKGDDAIKVLSSDGLELVIDLTVLFKVDTKNAPNLLKNIGADYKEKIVRPISRTRIRDVAAAYEAVPIYSTKRDEFQNRIYKGIEADFRKSGLILEQLLIRNINLPNSVKTTIESKINAEQDSQKMIFVLQKEKQEAERKRVEAQGIADYQRIMSSGLTEKQLQYEAIQAQKELAKSPNAKVIIMGKGNAPVMISQ
jgi:regulator of protease activity HflC (stomatin/prohibitin superfamily)